MVPATSQIQPANCASRRAPRSTLTQRTLAFASVAAAAPRKLLKQLLHWKQFKPSRSPSRTASRTAAANKLGSKACPALHGTPTAPRDRPAGGGARRPGVVWFRADLRLHDNEALARATAECSSVLPVYCFDPRDYGRSPQGYERTGPYRALFLIQAVADLRERLRAAGSELVVRIGRPEEVLADIVRRVGAAAVYCHTEVTAEEQSVETKVAAGVKAAGARMRSFWTNTLHHPDDLPFALADLPLSFQKFRESMAGVAPRAALAGADQLKAPPAGSAVAVEAGEVPTLRDLGLEALPAQGSASDAACVGGETEALRQLRGFLAAAKAAPHRSPGFAHGSSFSGSVAPWLVTGSLSPRRMLEEVEHAVGSSGAAAARGAGKADESGGSLQWVQFELMWRDFFRLMTKRHSDVVLPRARRAVAEAQRAEASEAFA